MRRFLTRSVALVAFSLTALAASFNGTLIDVMCKDQDPVKHTRKCAIGCAKSGYGLLTADGKFLKFDAAGNVRSTEQTGLERVAYLDPVGDKTPTLGKERSFLEDLFGNIGQVGSFGGGAGGAGGGTGGQ